jgi:AraC-like DNA-binding protein
MPVDVAAQTALFSASDIPDHRRDEFIRDFYGRIQMRLQVTPDPGHQLKFDARTLILPELMCTMGSVSPMSWSRSRELMSDDNDDIILSWNRGGYRLAMPGHGDFETRPGTAAILPLDRRWSAHTEDSQWTMALQFKRSLLAPLVKNLDDVPPDHIGRAQPAHQLLFDYLSSLHAMESPAALAPLASRHIADLLAASFGGAGSGPPAGGIRAARLLAIKRHVRRHLADPGLSTDQLSRRFGISGRYIRQLFAEDGTSFSDYLARQRLAHVHDCLSDRSQDARRIADIAFDVGFTEPSTFYRQFRMRYGRTPMEVRQSAMGLIARVSDAS